VGRERRQHLVEKTTKVNVDDVLKMTGQLRSSACPRKGFCGDMFPCHWTAGRARKKEGRVS
jgi:hypothetical protein